MSHLRICGLSFLRIRGVLATVVLVGAIGGPSAAQDRAPLASAAERKDAAAVQSLLTQGVDVNAAHGDGMTALHWAAMHGDVARATALLKAGADVRPITRLNGYTPLMLAARHGHGAVVEAAGAGADASATTDNGTTSLMFAAASGDVRSIDAPAGRGVDVNAREDVRADGGDVRRRRQSRRGHPGAAPARRRPAGPVDAPRPSRPRPQPLQGRAVRQPHRAEEAG